MKINSWEKRTCRRSDEENPTGGEILGCPSAHRNDVVDLRETRDGCPTRGLPDAPQVEGDSCQAPIGESSSYSLHQPLKSSEHRVRMHQDGNQIGDSGGGFVDPGIQADAAG